MVKYSLFVASCFLFGNQLCADPIQTITITSLTASAVGGWPSVSFTASGPSVHLSGSEGASFPSTEFGVGTPIGSLGDFTLPPFMLFAPFNLQGTIGTTLVELRPPSGFGPSVSGATNQLFPASAAIITYPGTVKGEYGAFACGMSETPPMCTGPQIANLLIDLPGILSVHLSPGSGPGLSARDEVDFASIPEPSSVILLFLGAALVRRLTGRRYGDSDERGPESCAQPTRSRSEARLQ